MSETKTETKKTQKPLTDFQKDFAMIGGLWKRESKRDGSKYLTGHLYIGGDDDFDRAKVDVKIYPKSKRKSDTDFEYSIYGKREMLLAALKLKSGVTQNAPKKVVEPEPEVQVTDVSLD